MTSNKPWLKAVRVASPELYFFFLSKSRCVCSQSLCFRTKRDFAARFSKTMASVGRASRMTALDEHRTSNGHVGQNCHEKNTEEEVGVYETASLKSPFIRVLGH